MHAASVSKRIFVFWFGPCMSLNRRRALSLLKRRSKVDVVLVDEGNLASWVDSQLPIHPSFPRLSATHKSDYLRPYFMLHHGGGYADIKPLIFDWRPMFESLSNSDLSFVGYPEVGPDGVAGGPDLKDQWRRLIGACYYIFKSGTDFCAEWLTRVEAILDEKADLLDAYPGDYHPRAVTGGVFQPRNRKEASIHSAYPLEWNEINGRIFHPLQLRHLGRFERSLPSSRFGRYR